MNTLNTAPTTAQMKAALATINPRRHAGSGIAEYVADTIAVGAANTVTGAVDAGIGTINFLDRVRTGYQFKRALDTGKLQLAIPDTAPKRAAKAG